MEFRKVHCFFEQTGTFKKAVRKLGYEALDYDIVKTSETDVTIDLFCEIEKAYEGLPSCIDNIQQDDLVVGFFPCIYFSDQSQLNSRGENIGMKNWSQEQKLKYSMDKMHERAKFYKKLCQLCILAYERGFQLIIENPTGNCGFLTQYFPEKNKVVIKDRSKLGDKFRKPTQFFFVNCEPSFKLITAVSRKELKTVENARGFERSIMTSEFAENFIKYFIV